MSSTAFIRNMIGPIAVISLVVHVWSPVVIADGCTSSDAANPRGISNAEISEQVGSLLTRIDQVQADVRDGYALAARVDLEGFSEQWDELSGAIGAVLPKRCIEVQAELERVSDALLGSLPEMDLVTSDAAMSKIRCQLLLIDSEIGTFDGKRLTHSLAGGGPIH